MIREICKDEAFLAQKAEPAVPADLAVAQDLRDTLAAHRESPWIGGCERCRTHLVEMCERAGFTPRLAYVSDDMVVIGERTPHVFCRPAAHGGSGSSSPGTAAGRPRCPATS